MNFISTYEICCKMDCRLSKKYSQQPQSFVLLAQETISTRSQRVRGSLSCSVLGTSSSLYKIHHYLSPAFQSDGIGCLSRRTFSKIPDSKWM